MPNITDNELIRRIISVCDTSGGPDACWPWLAKWRTAEGYGLIRVGGHVTTAHRALYLAITGADPNVVKVVRHTCDNPACCNDRHLVGGTQRENMADSITKGRRPRKYKEHRRIRKLSDDDVRTIRKDNRPLYLVAHQYSVSESLISRIRCGEAKQNVTDELGHRITAIPPNSTRKARASGTKMVLVPGKLRSR